MEWTKEAEKRLGKAPFFIRGFARRRAEEVAKSRGSSVVEIEDIEAAKGAKELEDVSCIDLTIEGVKDTKYKEIKPCGGLRGCPLTLFKDEEVVLTLERVLQKVKLEERIPQQIDGPVLYHHKFKGAVSGCPNCCSQPQIKDIGIIGYNRLKVNRGNCVGCLRCEVTCPEKLIKVVEGDPMINMVECLDCGRCIKVCPTTSIELEEAGYRVIIGGRLGRRPYLANKLVDVKSIEELEEVLETTVNLYLLWKKEDKSFSYTIESLGVEAINLQKHNI